MARQVVQLKDIGEVTFSQNNRSKNIKVSVKANKSVLVSFPIYVSGKEAMKFVVKNETWIKEQQKKMQSRQTKITPGSVLKTKLHTLKFLLGNNFDIAQQDNRIDIFIPDYDSEKAQMFIENSLTEIYRHEAKRLLPVRLAELASRHTFSYNKVTIRNNRRNWGSCSSKNNISLNLQMMKLPNELIDYILLHELVHTEIKNHGPKFWERLNAISEGQARKLAQEIKQYSTYTL